MADESRPRAARSSASPAAPRCCARSAARRSTSSGRRRSGRPTRSPPRVRRAAAPRSPRTCRRSSRRRAAPARVLDPGRDAALGDHPDAARRVAQPPVPQPQHLPRVHVPRDDAGLRGATQRRRTSPARRCTREVGDVLVVHFRNADRKLRQAVTMHPHGVKYNPEYDGAYMGEFTRAGGFIAPGRDVHLPVGVHAGLRRRLAVPRPRAQPHAEHVPRPVRRDHRAPEGRQAAGPHLHASSPTSCRRRSPASSATSSA